MGADIFLLLPNWQEIYSFWHWDLDAAFDSWAMLMLYSIDGNLPTLFVSDLCGGAHFISCIRIYLEQRHQRVLQGWLLVQCAGDQQIYDFFARQLLSNSFNAKWLTALLPECFPANSSSMQMKQKPSWCLLITKTLVLSVFFLTHIFRCGPLLHNCKSLCWHDEANAKYSFFPSTDRP